MDDLAIFRIGSIDMDLDDIIYEILFAISSFQALPDEEVAQFDVGLFNDLQTPTSVAELARIIKASQKAKMDGILAELANWKALLDGDPSEEALALMQWFCEQWAAADRVIHRMGYTGCPGLVPPHIEVVKGVPYEVIRSSSDAADTHNWPCC